METCFDDDTLDCCTLCARHLVILNTHFGKQKKNVKLGTTFSKCQQELYIAPDTALVEFELQSPLNAKPILVKKQISLKKMREWYTMYCTAELRKSRKKQESSSEASVNFVISHYYFKGIQATIKRHSNSNIFNILYKITN